MLAEEIDISFMAIIDEVGFLPISAQEANLFFQLVSVLYEQSSDFGGQIMRKAGGGARTVSSLSRRSKGRTSLNPRPFGIRERELRRRHLYRGVRAIQAANAVPRAALSGRRPGAKAPLPPPEATPASVPGKVTREPDVTFRPAARKGMLLLVY